MNAGTLEPADDADDAGDRGMLAGIIAEIPDGYEGDELELVVNTLNHRILSERSPLAVELADFEARREATRERADKAGKELIDMAGRADAALTAVLRLHGRRNDDDGRCRTCRTTKGKPAPWPCATWLAVADAGFVTRPSDELIEVLRAYGTWQNSRAERDWLRFDELSAAYHDRRERADEDHRH